MCIEIVCFPEYDVITFQINLIFLIQVVFQLDQKSQNTKLNILGTKRAFEVNFSSFLKGFHLPKTVSHLRVHL